MTTDILSRGLAIDVDAPIIRFGSVAVAFLSGIAVFLFTPIEQGGKEKIIGQKRVRRHELIGLAIVVAVTVIIAGFFVNGREALKRRLAAFPRYPNPSDFPIVFLSFAFLAFSRLVLVPLFARLGRRLISREKWGNEHECRVQRFAGQLWKVGYHSAATIAPMIILSGQKWWPPGFAADESYTWTDYPLTPPIPWLREYYLAQLGYYFFALELTLLQRERPNFIQMIVHHMATIGLVTASYFLENTVRFGTLVFWVHDVCDVPVCLTRLVVDLNAVAPTALFYASLMVTWVFYRLAVFPKIVHMVAIKTFREGWVRKEDSFGWNLTTPLLTTLIVMHWIWFYELAGMAMHYFRSGKRQDLTDSEREQRKVVSK